MSSSTLPSFTEETAAAANVIAPGAGGQFWVAGDHITFKLTCEQTGGRYAVGEIVTPPGGGPPPHVHGREDELFFILEGELAFVRGDESLRGGPGAVVFLPRGVPHAFRNIGQAAARFIVMTTPAGFDRFVPDAGCACTDPAIPPPMDDAAMGRLIAACGEHGLELLPEHRATRERPPLPATGTAYWTLGVHADVRLTAEQTGGQLSVAVLTNQPGGGVPPHLHKREDEIFVVLDGTYEFQIDGAPVTARPGTVVRIPRGVLHGFRNVGTTPARVFDCHTPGGFEKFFEECGVPCTDATAGAPPLPEPAFIMRMIDKHGMVMPPPPVG